MIYVIRHGKTQPNGYLSRNGKRDVKPLGNVLQRKGLHKAIVAPNVRSRQTAQVAGLRIVGEYPWLSIPDGYEEYLNKIVVSRMLAQAGEPWEKSFTKATLEDPLCDEFKRWGRELADAVRISEGKVQTYLRQSEAWYGIPEHLSELGPRPDDLVLIGSSPIVELSYLELIGSDDWQKFPRCRELDGYMYCNRRTELLVR